MQRTDCPGGHGATDALADRARQLADQQAALLRAALADRVYTDGFERQLAENLIAAIPAAQRGSVLEHILNSTT